MRRLSLAVFAVLVGFAGCGGDGELFSGASSSSSSAAAGSSASSSSSSSGDGGAGGASSSSSASGSSSSSSSGGGGDGGGGGSPSSSSSSSSSSSGTCMCPPYQECKDGTSTCWGCTKNNTMCGTFVPKTQGVECEDGYVPPTADCAYVGQQPEFPFKALYCCIPK